MISHHQGIDGTDDLQLDPHDWDTSEPVVTITVQRTS